MLANVTRVAVILSVRSDRGLAQQVHDVGIDEEPKLYSRCSDVAVSSCGFNLLCGARQSGMPERDRGSMSR